MEAAETRPAVQGPDMAGSMWSSNSRAEPEHPVTGGGDQVLARWCVGMLCIAVLVLDDGNIRYLCFRRGRCGR